MGLAALPMALTGCSSDPDHLHPAYSANVKYGVRTDPVMNAPGGKLGDERYYPDRPGILPIMKLEDVADPEHPYFSKKDSLDKVFIDAGKVSPKEREEIGKALEALFGTPAKPTVNTKDTEIDPQIISDLKLDDATLAMGSTRYRIHCLHCHGVPGDGRGPTARWINPHPRDFRQGLFKFQSTDQAKGQFPQRSDLLKTVRYGLEGTAMPSFNLLQDNELEALVSYVIHLSIRGEAEYSVFKTFANDPSGQPVWNGGEDTIESTLKFFAKQRAAFWHNAQTPDSAIKVLPYEPPAGVKPDVALKESALRGKQIFLAKISDEFKKEHAVKALKMQQLSSKVESLLKKKREAAKLQNPKLTEKELADISLDAKEKANPFSKDELASLEKEAGTKKEMDKAELYLKGASCVTCHVDYGRQARFRFDDWGTLVRPNNFTQGIFRGGKRPVDIYYRVHSGIRGSGMQSFYPTFKDHPEYLWDLVNFVSNLSYPAMRERLDLKIN
jgi:mono/diheme cytochrome c family protein